VPSCYHSKCSIFIPRLTQFHALHKLHFVPTINPISIVVLLLVGKPLYYMELLLGQFSSRGCIKVYDMAPAMRGIGIGQVMSTCFVTTYYASLMGLTIRYFLASFSSPLPWSECKQEWNVSCIDSSLKAVNFSDQTPKSSAELYFM
jgi:solute carrier family 6 amino acid transporter-like protein 5/7/9/14